MHVEEFEISLSATCLVENDKPVRYLARLVSRDGDGLFLLIVMSCYLIYKAIVLT